MGLSVVYRYPKVFKENLVRQSNGTVIIDKPILSRIYFMESFGFTVVNYKCTQLFANVIRLSNKIYASGTIT